MFTAKPPTLAVFGSLVLLLGLVALCALPAMADEKVVGGVTAQSDVADLPESMKPAPLDESGGFVDPRTLPPPEASESYLRMKEAMEQMQQAQEACETPLGTKLGHVHGVAAFSNCNDHHVSGADHVYTTTIPDRSNAVTAITGMKWQCVEFARRYLLKMYGVMFGDVMGAVDIWRFTSVAKYGDDSSRLNLGRYKNFDDADHHPKPGSMVVWPIQNDMPFGHVAIISEVVELSEREQQEVAAAEAAEAKDSAAAKGGGGDRKPRRVALVRIGDQNYRGTPWATDGYARELYLETYDGEYFGLSDPDGYRVFGWMTYEPFIKPLDSLLHYDEDPGMPKAAIPAEKGRFKGDADEAGAAAKQAAADRPPSPAVKATLAAEAAVAAAEDEGEF